MEVSLKFRVTARCNIYDTRNENSEPNKMDINFTLNKKLAENFIFRLGERNFMIGKDYKVNIRDTNGSPQIIIYTENKNIVVLNSNQLFEEILQGYNRLVALDKLNSIMEFDFDTAIEAQDLKFVEEEM